MREVGEGDSLKLFSTTEEMEEEEEEEECYTKL